MRLKAQVVSRIGETETEAQPGSCMKTLGRSAQQRRYGRKGKGAGAREERVYVQTREKISGQRGGVPRKQVESSLRLLGARTLSPLIPALVRRRSLVLPHATSLNVASHIHDHNTSSSSRTSPATCATTHALSSTLANFALAHPGSPTRAGLLYEIRRSFGGHRWLIPSIPFRPKASKFDGTPCVGSLHHPAQVQK